jgi:AraC-like DNA-binding protein
MKSGQIVVIDSFDVHEYINSGDEGFYDCVLVIPYEFLGDLLAQKNGFRIENPIVEDAELCDKIIRLADEFLCKKESISVQKATFKLVWSLLVEKLVFVEEKNRGEVALIRRALIYLQENFKGDVSRKSLAQKLGYAEAHLSRVFNRYLRMGIAEYVNSLRLEYIEQKFAENNGAGLLEVIYDAGFNCPQTYYRAKKKRAERDSDAIKKIESLGYHFEEYPEHIFGNELVEVVQNKTGYKVMVTATQLERRKQNNIFSEDTNKHNLLYNINKYIENNDLDCEAIRIAEEKEKSSGK